MVHIPTPESDVQEVCRIAKELGISLEDAAVTCDAFHLAFSDDMMRRAIFEMIDELDDEAARKGEPMGLIINYTVELGMDGIRVGRYADEIPAGEIVDLCPPHRARILLKINDNFPSQEFLGPLIVNRPGWHFDTFDPDAEMPGDFSHPESAREPIYLGPIRLKFNEPYPFLSPVTRHPLPVTSHPLPVTGDLSLVADHLLPVTCNLSPITSGLSPPLHTENLGHSDREMFLRQLAINE